MDEKPEAAEGAKKDERAFFSEFARPGEHRCLAEVTVVAGRDGIGVVVEILTGAEHGSLA